MMTESEEQRLRETYRRLEFERLDQPAPPKCQACRVNVAGQKTYRSRLDGSTVCSVCYMKEPF